MFLGWGLRFCISNKTELSESLVQQNPGDLYVHLILRGTAVYLASASELAIGKKVW